MGKPSKALASVVTDDELNAAYITPGVFNADLHTAVATAVGVPQADPPNCPGRPKTNPVWLRRMSSPSQQERSRRHRLPDRSIGSPIPVTIRHGTSFGRIERGSPT